MTAMQEIEVFEAQVCADEAVRRLLEDLTRSLVEADAGPSSTRLDPTAGLWLVGVVGLWKLAKVGIDYLRGLSEVALVTKQLELVREMQSLGCDAKQAAQVVERLLKGLRTRPDNDPVLKRLLQVVSP
ncbi:MAG: hypothetical protein AB7N91_27190 [Candidatus Tectimicrobiota bacterium]